MALEIEQHRIAGASILPPAPVRNGQDQTGQQHIVDAAMKRRRHPRQQRSRDRSRQREREMTRRAGDVAIGIERAVNQGRSRLTQHPGPERKLADAARILRVRRQPLRPTAERGAARRQRRRMAARNRLPGRRKVRHQDAPRHPVHRQDDGWSAAAARPAAAPASNHTACTITPAAGASRLSAACACSPMQATSPAASSPQMSMRRRHSAAGTAPGGAISRPHRRSPQAQRRAAATHRDDRAQPARRRSDDPPQDPPAPAAASPG